MSLFKIPESWCLCAECGALQRNDFTIQRADGARYCMDEEWCAKVKRIRIETLEEFERHGAPSSWSLFSQRYGNDQIACRYRMRTARHGDAEPQVQTPCEDCGKKIPPPAGRKQVRFKARRFCSARCSSRAHAKRKATAKRKRSA